MEASPNGGLASEKGMEVFLCLMSPKEGAKLLLHVVPGENFNGCAVAFSTEVFRQRGIE